MAKKSTKLGRAGKITPERIRRLVRMLRQLGRGSQLRSTLVRQLRVGMRGFYRDLQVLRGVGIHVKLVQGRYQLMEQDAQVVDQLPFPDPGLTLGEARTLSRGGSPGNKKISLHLQTIEG